MSLLLAPYNNAMRLGQGFNSYTQQICVDDAVVVDPLRAENVVTNDGTTMRIMAQKSATPSAWTRQKETIVESPATAVLEANAEKAKAEVHLIEEQLAEEEEDAAEKEGSSEQEPEPGHDEKDEEPSETTDSVDEVPDADEVRQEVAGPVEPESEVEMAHSTADKAETKRKTPQSSTTKAISKDNKSLKPLRALRSTSPSPGAKAAGESASTTRTTQKVTAARSDDEIDRDVIAANLRANDKDSQESSKAEGGDNKLDRDAIVANLKANAEKPQSVDQVTSPPRVHQRAKPVKRGASADRARQSRAALPAGDTDRAAIRAALTKSKNTTTPALSAQEEAERSTREREEQALLAKHRAERKKIEQEAREDERSRRTEEREEQRAIRAEKRQWNAKRREDARKAIENAANLKATSLQDLEKIRAQNVFIERFNGLSEQTQKYDFDPTAPRGPSQTVTYTSRFVDRLSDVVDDMSVSGSLSIKAGKIGGSGKGSFVDSDKFKESDLNFYISVKVVNQTINFKDALVYNTLRSVDKDNFREVYGDSFISGFVEGGEFNALVSMKILNKAKKTDIQAEAKIALTAGAVQVEAEANVGVARSNIETNTETTIQVSWSGGGHIKPMEQQWDIQSLMAAAARFPDLVADCPQRTYAILTKYDSLRSFVARKPATYTALQYENAQIYTGALLDSFISYKALYKRLGEQIFQVQGKTMEIQKWSDRDQQTVSEVSDTSSTSGLKDETTGLYPFQEVNTRFEASLKGLSDARTAVRRQMARIVNEVSLIEKDPKLATDEDHAEPFQPPVAFESRIPAVEVPERLRIKTHPLSGRRIMAKPLTEDEQKKAIEEDERLAEGSALFTANSKLSEEEQAAMQALIADNQAIGENFQVSSAAGDEARGSYFNNLDYLKQDWSIRSIRTELSEGALIYLAVSYANGLLVEKGAVRLLLDQLSQTTDANFSQPCDSSRVKKFGPFFPGERINSASIEHGRRAGEKDSQVLGLRLFTNRGRGLIARALHSEPAGEGGMIRDGVTYEKVGVLYLDVPFNSGTIKGFFGRSDDTSQSGRIWRLGVVWCRTNGDSGEGTGDQLGGAGDVIDSEDLALLQRDQSTGTKALRDTQDRLTSAQIEAQTAQKKLEAAQKALDDARNEIEKKDKQIQDLNNERSKKAPKTIEPQSGLTHAQEKGWRPQTNIVHRAAQTFSKAYSLSPKLIYGLGCVDCDQGSRFRAVSLSVPDVTPSEFTMQVSAFNGCNAYELRCAWMTLPDDLHLESGSIDTYEGGVPERDGFSQRVVFSQRFATKPEICVWLQEFDYATYDWTSISVSADNINTNSFTLNIRSWANRKFRSARAGWFAYPSEENGKRVKSGRSRVTREQKYQKEKHPFYGQPFSNTPATFIAISEVDFGANANLRLRCTASAPNNRELEWEYGTWHDSNMDHADVTWIAVE
ncbi:MAG: hypothetical protein Q9227_000114 [Pyrenula ochraceoflavens]